MKAGVRVLVGAVAGCAISFSNVKAQEAIELGEILVSAGRTPALSATVGSAHSIVTGEEIEDRQVRYVADALRLVPGLAVSQTGTSGGLTQIRMRGAEGNHVLVRIDGVEANDVAQGEFDFAGLLATDIERIEVIRGPQSAFWGSNATAGVINIITKSGRRGGFDMRLTSEAGTDGTVLVGPSVSGGGDRYDFALSGAFRRNEGFNISDFGNERDGHRNGTISGKARIDLAHNLFLDGSFRYVDRRADTDNQDFTGGPTQGLVLDTLDHGEADDLLGGIGLVWELLDGRFVQEARLQGNDVHRETYMGGALNSANEGDRLVGSYQASFRFDTPGARHTVTGGVEAKRERYRNLPPAPPAQTGRHTRDTRSLVGEYRLELWDSLFLTGALRQDDNDAFQDATTYSASAAYLLPTDTRIHASVGTGVTNPTFFEQFGSDPGNFLGNPDLRPERQFGWDVGVEQGFFDGRLVADVTYFKAKLEDEISVVFGPGVLTPVNLDGVSPREGVEVSITATPIENLSISGSYTYTDSEEPSGIREVRRPLHSGSLSAIYTFLEGRANVFTDIVFNGEMEDSEFITFGRTTLDSYTLVNVGGEFHVNDRFSLYGRVENLFDEDYEEVFGFNTPGTTAYLGMRMSLGSDSL